MDVDEQNRDEEPPQYSRSPRNIEDAAETAFGGDSGSSYQDDEIPFD